jgi:hypothetical protein
MTFRVLSLDGGGSWSLIQIMTLIDLYRSGGSLLTGHQVLRDFDLVVASSSGSLVLAALVKDLPLAEIQRYFDEKTLRQALYAERSAWTSPGARLGWSTAITPRYAAQRKFEGLRRLLNSDLGEPGIGDVTVDALKTRTRLPTQFIIAAFDYDRQSEVLFRSNPRSAAACFATPAIATLAEAVHAATNAPLDFFDAPAAVSRGRRCWDVAVAGHNNPILLGITEALANGVAPNDIQVLSLGTGAVILPLAGGNEDRATSRLVQGREPPRPGQDLRRLAASLFDDPPDHASLMAHFALGQRVPGDSEERVSDGNVVRMNPLLQPIRAAGGWLRPAGLIETEEEEKDEFLRLRELPVDATDSEELALIRKFCALWHNDAIVNQPVRANSDTLDCEIGHRWYSAAKGHWFALTQGRVVATHTPAPANVSPGGRSPSSPRIGGSSKIF